MKKIIGIVAVVFMLGACGEKDLKFYPTFEESVTIPVDNTVNETEFKGTISAADVNAAIDDVLDQTDGEIESVNIEALYFVVEPKSNNEVQKASFDAYIKSTTTGEYVQILDDYEVLVDASKKQAPLDDLMSAGVNEIIKQLEDVVINNGVSDMEFKIDDVVGVVGGEHVVVDVTVYVKGTVTFAQTVEML